MSAIPFQTYRLEFTPLSPVHIGSGLTVEPYEYLIEKQEGNWFLFVLDLPRLIQDLDRVQRQELDKALHRADFPMLRSWLRNNACVNHHARYHIQIQDGAVKDLNQIVEDPNSKGQIDLFCRRASDGVPYIPGSSIKGAIRTAVIDYLLKSKKDIQAEQYVENKGGNIQLEALALGNIDRSHGQRGNLYRDPFRQLAISDIHLQSDSCYIDRIKIVRPPTQGGTPRPSEEKIKIYRDMTWSYLDGETVSYTGQARLFSKLAHSRSNGDAALSRSLSTSEIVEACNAYYMPEVEQQLDRFTPRTEGNDRDIREPLLQAVEDLRENECVIRLGRHTHFECMTFSDPFNKPPEKGKGKTRSYVDGSLPLGWARLRFQLIK